MSQHHYAVIGDPVAHSLSPQIHGMFGRQEGVQVRYGTLHSSAGAFAGDVRGFFDGGGRGLNVTLPFKAEAARLAARLDPSAERAGAANVLTAGADGGGGDLTAHNTDGSGLLADLDRRGLGVGGASLLLLGAGGAAAGVLPALLERDPAVVVVCNRTLNNAMTLIERLGQPSPERLIATSEPRLAGDRFDLAIDATSIGVGADGDGGGDDESGAALLRDGLQLCDALYALSYDAQGDGGGVASVALARQLGIPAWDGLGMLVEQAADSWRIWHGSRPDTRAVLQQLRGEAQA